MTKTWAGSVNVLARKCSDGTWLLRSRDLPGLLLWGPNLEALQKEMPAAIKFLVEKNLGISNVVVAPTVSALQMPMAVHTPVKQAHKVAPAYTFQQLAAA